MNVTPDLCFIFLYLMMLLIMDDALTLFVWITPAVFYRCRFTVPLHFGSFITLVYIAATTMRCFFNRLACLLDCKLFESIILWIFVLPLIIGFFRLVLYAYLWVWNLTWPVWLRSVEIVVAVLKPESAISKVKFPSKNQLLSCTTHWTCAFLLVIWQY